MRTPSSLVLTVWAVVGIAQAQTPAPAPPQSGQPASHAAAPRASSAARAEAKISHPARQPRARDSRAAPVTDTPHAAARPAKGDGVLALGASDITGNKELPKVMVIVPWKSSPGAGGVIEPADSLMDEVLGPVDRGVFQRRIRYYGQLNAAGRPSAAEQMAPVGDRR